MRTSSRTVNWYRTKNRIFVHLPPELDGLEGNYEGKVWGFAAEKAWSDAVAACWEWARVEPYSTRPYLVGSYWSCVTEDEPELGRKFCEDGLKANPDSPALLNNLAFSYGRFGVPRTMPDAL